MLRSPEGQGYMKVKVKCKQIALLVYCIQLKGIIVSQGFTTSAWPARWWVTFTFPTAFLSTVGCGIRRGNLLPDIYFI